MAEEKKLSKTAQAREDAKNRRHFKEKCYEILMTKMLENSIDMRTSNKIQIQITNTNRYFSVRRYGQYLNIAIFTSGDIDMHTFMDYVEGSGDVIKAYESLMEDRKKYHDDY